MKLRRIILIAFSLFLLVSITIAADQSSMTTGNDWLVADGSAHSTITVHVMQDSSPVSGATVVFSLAGDSQDLGTLSSPLSVITGSDGIATTVFTTKTKSGTATINAMVTYNDGHTIIPLSCVQHVDHDIPYMAIIDQPYNVPAGSVTHLNITLKDVANNLIDNKNPAEVHNIVLQMSGDGGSGFLKGTDYVPSVTVPTNADGNVSVDLRVSTVSGPNNVQVSGIGWYTGDVITIWSIADSEPCYLVQVHPTPSTFPADGKAEHTFNPYWTVLDKNNNPIGGVELLVRVSSIQSPADVIETRLTTASGGSIGIPVGPSNLAGIYMINATPVIPGTTTPKNTTLICSDTSDKGFCSQTVEFMSLDPVDMMLTASPQTMVSMDVAGATPVTMKARVVDISGNGVKGQTVTFTKTDDTFTTPDGAATTFTETSPSSLTPPASVTTDDNGYATIPFVPGTFAAVDASIPETGSCKVTATWTDGKTLTRNREITFVWKNYPFLTVESAIDNPSPNVGDTVNVKIWIKGRGALLQPKPIDVVLCEDRSGSMLENYPGHTDDAMVEAKAAASTFATKLKTGDHIGIVSFGDVGNPGVAQLAPKRPGSYWEWTNVYGNWYWVASDSQDRRYLECGSRCNATGSQNYDVSSVHQKYVEAHYNNGNSQTYYPASTDLTLDEHNQADITNALNGIVPAGGTPMREGLTTAVNLFPAYSANRPIRAIILMTDGQYTTQDPASNPSVITVAKNNKIKIFTIGLGSGINTAALRSYADQTGGKNYTASDPSQLANIYTDIVGELNKQAGGNTNLDIDFGKVKVGSSAIPNIGDYIDYVYNDGGVNSDTSSTLVRKYAEDPVTHASTSYYYEYVRDDTRNWTGIPSTISGDDPKNLSFSVGNIVLNDVWMTNIQFKVTKAGYVEIFGANSPVTFTDGITGAKQQEYIPTAGWNGYENQNGPVFGPPVTLTVNNVAITPNANDPNVWTVSWNTVYDGEKIVKEKLLYCSETGSDPVSCNAAQSSWPIVPNQPPDISKGTTQGSLPVDTSTWKPGKSYRITVVATEPGIGGKENSGYTIHPKNAGSGTTYIKLE